MPWSRNEACLEAGMKDAQEAERRLSRNRDEVLGWRILRDAMMVPRSRNEGCLEARLCPTGGVVELPTRSRDEGCLGNGMKDA